MGTGSAIGHRMVGAVMGPMGGSHAAPAASQQVEQQTPSAAGRGACFAQMKAFNECLNDNTGDLGKCQPYADMLTACKRGEFV